MADQRSSASALAAAAIVLSSIVAGPPAWATDWRAESAAKDAIKKTASDFAAGDFATAAARLTKALSMCGEKKCSPGTKAFVLRDLGTMQFRMGDKDAAAVSFQQALSLDRDIELSSKYDAPDVHAAWNHAKSLASTTPGAPPPEQPIGGDFNHTPPTEQKVRTPLPVYVEPPEGASLARVVVKYKGTGMSDWGKIELAQSGDGWAGLIPCGAVADGALVYWVQGFDSSGSPVASSGDPKHPFTVPIRDEISGEAPSLPGKDPPRTCAPGEEGGAEGDSGEGATAEGGVRRHGRYARLWVGGAATFEFMSMPTVNDACALQPGGAMGGYPQNSSNLYCVDNQGNDYPARTVSGVATNNQLLMHPGSAGHSDGGFQTGDVRLMLSVDYALNQNLLVGGRFGYVFNSYPGSAASQDGRAAGFKFHVEGRATYLLGSAPLEQIGFAPMGFAGLGLGEFDGHVTTVVQQQPIDIWDTDGPFFLLLGAGVRYQFSPRIAGTAAGRLNVAIGGNGVLSTFGPEFGVMYGF
jgi:hypothetical protein